MRDDDRDAVMLFSTELHIFTKQAYQRKHGRHLESNPQALCMQGNHQESAPTPYPSSYRGATSGSLPTNGLVSIAKEPFQNRAFVPKKASHSLSL